MSTVTNEIKVRVKQLQEEMNVQGNRLARLKEEMKKMKLEIKGTEARIATYDGAIQAFNVSLDLTDKEVKTDDDVVLSQCISPDDVVQ